MADNTDLLINLIQQISSETGGITKENNAQYKAVLFKLLRPSLIAQEVQTIDASDGTAIWDVANGYTAEVTLTQATVLKITDALEGDFGSLKVSQDALGGHVLTLPGNARVAGGSLGLTTDPNAIDIITWVLNGEYYYFTVASNFS